jgi:hypothetical protein
MGVFAVLATCFAGSLAARAENWELLGEKRVAFIADRDVIVVGRHEGRFRKLRLAVHDNNIHLDRLVVIYGNGEPDVFEEEIKIRAGDSRIFDLKGHARTIQRIELYYRSKLNILRGEAHVRVFGEQAGGGDSYGDRREERREEHHEHGHRQGGQW